MRSTLAQLDAAEARLLKEWRANVLSPANRAWFRKRGRPTHEGPSPLRTSRDVVTRMLFALSEHEYDIAKTRSWLEVFDRSALDALDDYEEQSMRDEENGACACCPEQGAA